MSLPFRILKRIVDMVATFLLWGYFLLVGFLFIPFFLAAFLFARDHEAAFQRHMQLFCRGFFLCARLLVPRLAIKVSPEVQSLRSSVVICNHLSFLDPLLLIASWSRHRSLAKSRYFKFPVFGWLLRHAGYLPTNPGPDLAELWVEHTEDLRSFLGKGGNLFVFPEGTRSLDGSLGDFRPGAFKISVRWSAPLEVLHIKGSARLFKPGRFLFNTCVSTTIEIEHLGTLTPGDGSHPKGFTRMMEQAKELYLRAVSQDEGGV